jgi:hypothetical protein
MLKNVMPIGEIEAPFTMPGDRRDAKATPLALSKYKLTRSLACRENPGNTVSGMTDKSGISPWGLREQGNKAR